MEILQATLYVTIILLCTSLTVFVIYAVFLLKEVKETVDEANKVVGAVSGIITAVLTPISTLVGVLTGITKGARAIKSLGIFDGEEEK